LSTSRPANSILPSSSIATSDALLELIEEKKKGHVPRARPAANDDGKVIDLMAALRRSLKSSGVGGSIEQRPAAASRRREPAKRGPAPRSRPRRRGSAA